MKKILLLAALAATMCGCTSNQPKAADIAATMKDEYVLETYRVADRIGILYEEHYYEDKIYDISYYDSGIKLNINKLDKMINTENYESWYATVYFTDAIVTAYNINYEMYSANCCNRK